MSAITIESGLTAPQTTTETGSWKLPSLTMPRFIGRLTAITMVEQADRYQQFVSDAYNAEVQATVGACVLLQRGFEQGTDPSNPHYDHLLTLVESDLIEASHLLFDEMARQQ